MTKTIGVTEVTHNADTDEYSDAIYREMYEEIRGEPNENGKHPVSLRALKKMLNSEFSHATWGNYHDDPTKLNREMRNELRRYLGRPALPATIVEVAETIDKNALVVQVGDGQADRLIMLGTEVTTAAIHVNGTITAEEPQASEPERHVTTVTRPARARKQPERICIPKDYKERYEAFCEANDCANGADALRMMLDMIEGTRL